MSTKIYNAFKLPPIKDIYDMHEMMMGIGTKVQKELENRYKERVISDYISYVDDCTINDKIILKSLLDVAWEVCDKHNKIKQTGRRNVYYDFYFECTIFPHKKTNASYAMFFVDVRCVDFLNFFTDKGFTDFHYQNSTDKHESISEKEWDKRRDAWDDVFKGDYCMIPKNAGFSYDFTPELQPFDCLYLKNFKFIPTLDKRVRRIAQNQIYERKFEKQELWYKAMKYLESEEGLREINELSKSIKKRLMGRKDIEKMLDEKYKNIQFPNTNKGDKK